MASQIREAIHASHMAACAKMQTVVTDLVEEMERNYHARSDHPDSETIAYYSSLATFKEMRHQISEVRHRYYIEYVQHCNTERQDELIMAGTGFDTTGEAPR
jgi:hypothetical protein